MSTHEGKRPIDPATAERLLGLEQGTGHGRLADLLAAAAAPAGAGELPGEFAAMAAFRAAQTGPFPRQQQRQSMIKTTLAKLVTVKIAAICAGVLGVGGVAVAATTGTIPTPLHIGGPSSSASPRHHPPKPSGTPSARPSRSTPPGLFWLCHDYIGRDRDHRGKALDDPKFGDLVKGAGHKDRDQVDKFCGKVLKDGPTATPSGLPSGFPTVRPSDRPEPSGQDGRQGNGSDAHPSSLPTTRPSESGSPRPAR